MSQLQRVDLAGAISASPMTREPTLVSPILGTDQPVHAMPLLLSTHIVPTVLLYLFGFILQALCLRCIAKLSMIEEPSTTTINLHPISFPYSQNT